jgi:hypothetical protein
MKRVVLVACLLLVAQSTFAQVTLTVNQKVKLTVVAVDAAGAPLTLPPYHEIVWTVDGNSREHVLGVFVAIPLPSGVGCETAAWFIPTEPGVFTIRAGTVIPARSGQEAKARYIITVVSVPGGGT